MLVQRGREAVQPLADLAPSFRESTECGSSRVSNTNREFVGTGDIPFSYRCGLESCCYPDEADDVAEREGARSLNLVALFSRSDLNAPVAVKGEVTNPRCFVPVPVQPHKRIRRGTVVGPRGVRP